MDEKVSDLLLLQQFKSKKGEDLHLIWKVAAAPFMLALKDKQAEGHCINKAKILTLRDFYEAGKAEYIGTTNQDAELFAANLREEGVYARFVKGVKDVPKEYFEGEDDE